MNHRSLTGVTLLAVAVVVGLSMGRSRDSESTEAESSGCRLEAPFLAETAAAMDRMMAGMEVRPTSDVDTDFAAMMIPHHQGAIDMALAYLRSGKNEQVRRIAQEIIVDQQQEIVAMRFALGQPLLPSVPAPTQVSPSDQLLSPHMPAHNHTWPGREPRRSQSTFR